MDLKYIRHSFDFEIPIGQMIFKSLPKIVGFVNPNDVTLDNIYIFTYLKQCCWGIPSFNMRNSMHYNPYFTNISSQ